MCFNVQSTAQGRRFSIYSLKSDIYISFYSLLGSQKTTALDDLAPKQRTIKGLRQSDNDCSRFKGNVGETSERRDEAHMGISEGVTLVTKSQVKIGCPVVGIAQ